MVGVPISPWKQKFFDVFLEYCQAIILPMLLHFTCNCCIWASLKLSFYMISLSKRDTKISEATSLTSNVGSTRIFGKLHCISEATSDFCSRGFPKKSRPMGSKTSVLSAKWHLQILQRSSTPQAGFLAFAWGRPVGQRVKNRRGCQPRWLVVEFQPNPFWNMMRKSKWEKSSPTRGGNKKDLEPPPRYILFQVFFLSWLNPSENIFGKVWNLRRLSGYIWTLFTSLDLFRADSFFVSAKFPPGQTSCHAVLFADFFTPKLWATRVWSQTGNCPDRLISHHNI